ncbi:MAG: lytic murein transglycosylase B [Mariprofundaceae bacterium]|nr:lytic murein transglycosylase B [Mariprofundaceae bacterium]
MQTYPFTLTRRTLIKTSVPALATIGLAPTLLYAANPQHHQRLELIDQLVQQTGLARQMIEPIIMQAQFEPSIIKRIKTPYESRSYAEYRPLFVHSRLAKKGTAYLHQHAVIFADAEKKYGVQKEIIAAVLGMETRYGVNRGNDLVVNSLFTLATGYPRRAQFFRKELGELLLLCQEEGLQPLAFRGSYAGAFGTTQFIPSSYRAYAVDSDGDGKRNVCTSPADIIDSVANYFQRHGWQHTHPLARWLSSSEAANIHALHLKQGFKHWHHLLDMRSSLPPLDDRWHDNNQVTLIEMTSLQGKQMALVDYNFYVITRWNRSYNYAMAVTELAALMGCEACQTHV